MTRAIPILFVLFLLPGISLAQPAKPAGIFEVIPKESSAALVLRSIDDFKTKGKKLIKDLELPGEDEFDKLIGEVYKALNITGGVDEKAPVAVAILQGQKERNGFDALEDIVLLIPIADRDKILAGYMLQKKPADGDVVEIKNGGFISPKALVVRGNYLCLGLSDAPLKRLTNESLAVSADEKKQFGDSDLLLYLGKRAWPMLWGDYLTRLDGYFGRRKDEEERKVGRQFIKGLRATEHSFIGARVDDGVRLKSNMVFDVKKDKDASAMLEMLKAGTNRSSVKGLPDGRALAALGWAGDGSKAGILTKLFFDVFLEGPLPGQLNDLPIFASTDYPSVVAVTHNLSQQLKGVRVGLYHNLNEKELGLFSAVAIIDTADGPAFLKEIRTLSKIANLTEADLKLPETQKFVDLEKLANDLNSGMYTVRQSAATRLLLIGSPALPHLQKVIDKPASLEQKRRAEGIKTDIDRAAEQGRKDLLMPKEMPRTLRANFAIALNVEKRSGTPIDVLKMSFNTKNEALLKQVQQLLGPNWDKLRLALVGDQLIVFMGSDVAMLDQTIANLKAGKNGLDGSKLFAGFDKRADKSRTVEMHGSAQGFLGLLASEWKLPAKLFRDPPMLTSFAISFETDRLLIDLWVPTRELRTMVHAVYPAQ
jgi:hypothetical protein